MRNKASHLQNKSFALVAVIAVFVGAAHAVTIPRSNVMNFEGDIIEGERKRPDLFLQRDVKDVSLDAILFLRRDFNDFEAVDRGRRPMHFRSQNP